MSIDIKDLFNLIKQREDIKELLISENNPLTIGVLKELQEPINRNGKLINKGIVNVKYDEFGVLDRNDCVSILKAFQMNEKHNLLPNSDKPFITVDNDLYRLVVVDQPSFSGLSITYREFENTNKTDLDFFYITTQ